MDLTNSQMGPISSSSSKAQVGVVPNVATHCRKHVRLGPTVLFRPNMSTATTFNGLFLVSGLKDEKLIKKQTYMKTET